MRDLVNKRACSPFRNRATVVNDKERYGRLAHLAEQVYIVVVMTSERSLREENDLNMKGERLMVPTADTKKMISSVRALLEESPPRAGDIVELFRTAREYIPKFGPLDAGERLELRAASVTDPLFVQASINTVGASKNMESMIGRTAAELRLETDEAAQWTAVEDEVRVILEGVAAANLVRRHRIGLTALQTYSAARQLVRAKEHANLLPHVAEMKRLNRFGKKRLVKTAIAPAAAEVIERV